MQKRNNFNGRTTTQGLLIKYGVSFSFLDEIARFAALPKDADMEKALAAFMLPARSGLEKAWLPVGRGLVEKLAGSKVVFTGYELFSFKLVGASYKGDYYYLLKNGQWVVVDIKAPYRRAFASYSDASAKMRAAATLHPYATFVRACPDKKQPDGWLLQALPVDYDFVKTLKMIQKEGEQWEQAL